MRDLPRGIPCMFALILAAVLIGLPSPLPAGDPHAVQGMPPGHFMHNPSPAPGVPQARSEKPKVMVIMDEKVSGLFGTTASENVRQAETTIIEKLLNSGFNVVDPDQVRANLARDKALRLIEGNPVAAAAEGLKYGAQVVISGKAYSKNAGGKLYGTNMQSLQATVTASAINTDTGKVIGSKSGSDSQVHIDELQGGALAIKEASSKVADELIDLMRKQLSPEGYGRSQEVALMITGLVSYRHIAAVRYYLEKETQGVKAVHQRSFINGIGELMIEYNGKSSELADDLANRNFTGFRLEPTNVTPGRIDIRAVVDGK